MKTGIITFHKSNNYGAVLQAYALQHVINKYTICEIIDYRSDVVSGEKKLMNLKESKGLKGTLKRMVAEKYYTDKNINFNKFLKSCHLSEKVYTVKNISTANQDYDVFITGSDQVFNLNMTHGDKTYYLDFVSEDKKKIAYAASLGSYRFESHDTFTKKQLVSMDHISCREPEAAQAVERFTGRKAEVVLDPTLLLNPEEWESVEEPYNHISSAYILLYLISPENKYFRLALEIAAFLKLPLYYINYSPRLCLNPGIKNLLNVTPGQFLYLLHHAAYVITNSFHGTAISIIYKKNFFTVKDRNKSMSNQRIERILDLFSLQERFIAELSDLCTLEPDYSQSAFRLEQEKKKSITFLENAGILRL